MSEIKRIRTLLDMVHGSTKKVVKGITDEESMHRGKDGVNHIRWLMGHILYEGMARLKCMHSDIDLPEDYKKLFGYGSELSENPGDYPNMDTLLREFDELHERTLKQWDTLSEEDLDKIVDLGDDWKAACAEAVVYLCLHEFYHVGQITTMTRILGRDKPFG